MAATEGAILQRDGGTYAVVTRIPAGIVAPDDLEKIAKVGRKYRIPMLKITSGQRIALIGIEPGNVQDVIHELGPLAKSETAPCIKFVQACLGTDMCRYGNQDSIGLAHEVDRRLQTRLFPRRSRSVSPAARAAAARATPGTSGSWGRTRGGRSSLAATRGPGRDFLISSHGTF